MTTILGLGEDEKKAAEGGKLRQQESIPTKNGIELEKRQWTRQPWTKETEKHLFTKI